MTPLHILLVDDDLVIRTLAEALLRKEGLRVTQASSAQEALALFDRDIPDLVLTDIEMPGMDGLALAREIRLRSGDRLVPVVVLTARNEATLLRESLEAGAVEFLTKPLDPLEFLARIRALSHLVRLHARLRDQKAQADDELQVVKHMLDRFRDPNSAAKGFFATETLRTERIQGDTCLLRQGLPGIHFGLMCDATGHGLMSGVSTIPVVEAFHSMVTKDLSLRVIYREINAKLRRILPADRFVCLLLFRINTHQGTLGVLNAGMPEALLLRKDAVLRRFPSTELPAGIVEAHIDAITQVETTMAPGDRVLIHSDGLLDLLGPSESVAQLLSDFAGLPLAEHHARFRSLLRGRVRDTEMQDDISWALCDMPVSPPPMESGLPDPEAETELDPALETTVRILPKYLGTRSLMPGLHALLTAEGVDQETLQTLGLLLSEAVTNALDHGVLSLPSSLKTQEGFEAYERRRGEALAALEGGEIHLRLLLQRNRRPPHAPRRLDITVTDSGPGFPWKERLAMDPVTALMSHGRGLVLLSSLGTRLTFNQRGNEMTFSLPCGRIS